VSLDVATRALQTRSGELLRGELHRAVAAYDGRDDRDLMVSLAPLHDCARRIGLDAVALFDEAAASATPEVAVLLQHFARRADITPEAFGFALVGTADGRTYVWR
jgi:hypothetical protein